MSGVIGGLLATAIITLAGDGRPSSTTLQPAAQNVVPSPITPGGVAALAERLRPAIVQVTATTAKGRLTGSGVIFTSDGAVLTDESVVRNASAVSVLLADGRLVSAHVVGTDAETDVAVVRIEGGPFATATLGERTAAKAGDICVAIGALPGSSGGGPAVSAGVISGLGRSLVTDDGTHLYDLMQTDAAVPTGSSGGALVDEHGVVIGITIASPGRSPDTAALGFATPIDVARSVAEQLAADGRATHVWMGVEGDDIDTAQAQKLGVPGGAVVRSVASDGPAAAAGLRAGDVVLAVDGHPVMTMADLVVAVRAHHVGDAVTMDVLRGFGRVELLVRLVARPSS